MNTKCFVFLALPAAQGEAAAAAPPPKKEERDRERSRSRSPPARREAEEKKAVFFERERPAPKPLQKKAMVIVNFTHQLLIMAYNSRKTESQGNYKCCECSVGLTGRERSTRNW